MHGVLVISYTKKQATFQHNDQNNITSAKM